MDVVFILLAAFKILRFACISSHRLPSLFDDWSERKYGAFSVRVETRSRYESYILQGRIWFVGRFGISISHVVGVISPLIDVQHDDFNFSKH